MQSIAVTRDGNDVLIELLPQGLRSGRVIAPVAAFSILGLLSFPVAAISSKINITQAALFVLLSFGLGTLVGVSNWFVARRYVQIRVCPDRLVIKVMRSKSAKCWEWDRSELVAVRVFAKSEDSHLGLCLETFQEGKVDRLILLEGKGDEDLRRVAQIIRSTMKLPISV
ncbi:MAG: hypothetical protein H6813_03255 [Phycisphaeraceae bacterium]|nr:hypothetical protein [Phycisphaeraceae bacterium]MCB9846963.1 hypothetical protein [Phycisphaeraceae bacterium]